MITSPRNMDDIARAVTKACEDMNAMMSGYIGATTKASTAALQGLEDIARDMNGLLQQNVTRALDAGAALMSAQTPQEAVETHADFLKDCYDGILAGSGKVSEISIRAAQSAIDPLAQHANDAIGAIVKTAKTA